MKLFVRGRREKNKKERERREKERKTTASKDDDDVDIDDDEEGGPEVRWKGECAVSKLPNYFSSCPRGPGKIIIKTSRGSG